MRPSTHHFVTLYEEDNPLKSAKKLCDNVKYDLGSAWTRALTRKNELERHHDNCLRQIDCPECDEYACQSHIVMETKAMTEELQAAQAMLHLGATSSFIDFLEAHSRFNEDEAFCLGSIDTQYDTTREELREFIEALHAIDAGSGALH